MVNQKAAKAELGRVVRLGMQRNTFPEGVFPLWADGMNLYAICSRDREMQILAGGHWFTVAEALAYWSGDTKHDRINRCAVECLVAMAKARGWELADG